MADDNMVLDEMFFDIRQAYFSYRIFMRSLVFPNESAIICRHPRKQLSSLIKIYGRHESVG